MKSFSKVLKQTLQDISFIVYDLLEVHDDGSNIRIRQVHEDGVSSIILKKLAKLKNQGFNIVAKNLGVHEKKTGIDFNLWIGENDEKYIRLLVQAKSFGNQMNTENSYSIDSEQCEMILAHSEKEHESFPLYFLYQFIDDPNLKLYHFSFLEDFRNEYTSVTFTSAYNIQKLIKSKNLKFSDIHKNDFQGVWKNNAFDIFQQIEEQIGLPLYLLHDISPSSVEKFQTLISTKENSLGLLLLLLLLFGENFPFKIHKITAAQIEELYGKNDPESEVQFKNLVIINDNFKLIRDRQKKLKRFLRE
ncbi:MAG TPA: hypothetical protein DHV48_20530 [Prolixibacteraceae bacterium]|nr:hypothetical protein [Prolixibacteraceae bacterium]